MSYRFSLIMLASGALLVSAGVGVVQKGWAQGNKTPEVQQQDGKGGDSPKDGWKQAKPNGQPRSCISLTELQTPIVRDDKTIDFILKDGSVIRNILPDSCPQLGFEEHFSYSRSMNRLCSTDVITVLVSPGLSRGASCGLGHFQPVTTPPKEETH